MAKHTQTIHRQFADELFECVWSFLGLALKGLITKGAYTRRRGKKLISVLKTALNF